MKQIDRSEDSGMLGPGLAEMRAAQWADIASRRNEHACTRNSFTSDRTLMEMMRTPLSMIDFGFNIFPFFNPFFVQEKIGHALPSRATGRVVLALVIAVRI